MRVPIARRKFLAVTGSASVLTAFPAIAASAGRAPDHLNGHSGAYDSRRRASLIFGGADERQVLGQLWQLQNGRWRLLSASGPSPRTFTTIAYDDRRDRLVVFGGNRVLFGTGGDTVLDDHWEWDGRSWHRFEGVRPPGRSEACCAFDTARGKLVLFGGWRFKGDERVRLNDVWEFDSNGWAQSPAVGPERRSGAAMTYDSNRRRILLAGGNGPKDDFWALDGSGWSRLPHLPQPRFNPVMAFDRPRSQAVLFGGFSNGERLAATALFDGRAWRPADGPEPLPRNHAVLIPSDHGSRLLLVGGHNGDEVFADQWDWNGHWSQLQPPAPLKRVPNNH